MLLKPFKLHTPTTLQAAVELYASLEDARLQAGGTFLLNSLKLMKKRGAKTPQNVISLGHINELKGISEDGDAFIIKSMTTIDDMFNNAALTAQLPLLKIVATNISTQPIRNVATVGGNLTCRYTWTEMPAVMTALEADMHFLGKDGREEVLPAQEFFQKAAKTDKIFTQIRIPKDPQRVIAYFRAKKSPYIDIPLLSLCIKTRFQGDRFSETVVAVNNCVAFAQRDRKLEEFLNRSQKSATIIPEALEHLETAIYDTRSSEYKKHMFRVGIKQALADLIGEGRDNT